MSTACSQPRMYAATTAATYSKPGTTRDDNHFSLSFWPTPRRSSATARGPARARPCQMPSSAGSPHRHGPLETSAYCSSAEDKETIARKAGETMVSGLDCQEGAGYVSRRAPRGDPPGAAPDSMPRSQREPQGYRPTGQWPTQHPRSGLRKPAAPGRNQRRRTPSRDHRRSSRRLQGYCPQSETNREGGSGPAQRARFIGPYARQRSAGTDDRPSRADEIASTSQS